MHLLLGLSLFSIGTLGFVLNTKNLIIMLIALELLLFSANLILLVTTHVYQDISGQALGLVIITIAGVESAIGLGLYILIHRLRHNKD